MTLNDSEAAGRRPFPPTSWSALRQLRAEDGADLREPLTRLAQMYWKPIHCVIRYRWSRTTDEARDLTQDFFERVLLDPQLFRSFAPERGGFRAFLRGALDHFMNNVVRDAGRLKRGGGVRLLSLDGDPPELADLAPEMLPPTPEDVFDLAWDGFVLREALDRLRTRLESTGRAAHFEAFRRYDLEGESEDKSYEELSAELGWTVRKLRRVLTETRASLREALAEVICPSVDDPDALGAEIRRLLGG